MIHPPNGGSIFDDRLHSFLDALHIPTLDLGSADLTPDEYFRGDGHWNERGHQKAARHLVPFVEQLFETPVGSGERRSLASDLVVENPTGETAP